MKSKINLVVIDSNFILLPFQFKIDYLNEIRLKLEGKVKFIIYRQIFQELEAKSKRESKNTKFSILLESGLTYLEKYKDKFDIEIIESIKNQNETTDNFILRKVLELKEEGNFVYLATNDSELRRKANKNHINTIFLRQKKFLAIE